METKPPAVGALLLGLVRWDPASIVLPTRLAIVVVLAIYALTVH
jgi:hypothetical protein